MPPKKKLMNNPENCVREMLEGISAAYPALHVNLENHIVMLNRDRKHKVGILSGGGAGHEPFVAGYVGECMLTAAVIGNVFSSPPASCILAAITQVARLNKGGVFIIILNYTGDILNFGLAIETARSKGIQVECVVIADDAALSGKEMHSITGKRGIAGALFAMKIAGALSSAGRTLAEIALETRAVNCCLASMGVCLYPCTLPAQAHPLFPLDEDSIDIGCGIHGEAGITRSKVRPAHDIIRLMMMRIFNNLVIKTGDPVCVIVNNLGTLTQLEMGVVCSEVKRQLADMNYKLVRLYCGTLVTSLDMSGIQISVLNVTGKEEWISFLDFDTEAYAWPGRKVSHIIEKYPDLPISFEQENKHFEVPGMELSEKESNLFRNCIRAACENLKSQEQKLNQLDSICGDGDCGTTLRHFCDEVLKNLQMLPVKKVGTTFMMLSHMAEKYMGGTSGALYSLMLLGAAKNSHDWPSAWVNSIQMLRKYSSASLGHRTMLDALIPACQGFTQYLKDYGSDKYLNALKMAIDKAIDGCDATLNMVAKAGRASYVTPSKINDVDAGAQAVVIWLKAIYRELTS